MTSPWLFAVWGINLINQLPKGRGGVQYAVVIVDYFTKWVEAKAFVFITLAKIKGFMYKNIVCHSGVFTLSYQITTNSLIAMNSKNFVITFKLKRCSLQWHDLRLMAKSRPSTR